MALAVDAAPPARWAFLYPWCRVLRGKLHLEGRTAESSARWEYRWVAVRLPHAPEHADTRALRRIREALDLLARVALIDNAAWRALLVQQCRVPRDEDDQPLDCELHPRFRFVFNEKFVELGASSPAAVCKGFFVTASAQRESDDYLEARRALAEVEAMQAWQDVGVETAIPFELQFELVTLPDDTLEAHLRDLDAVLGIMRAHQKTGGLLPLELESIRLDVGGINMSWSLTQRLRSLLSSGLQFSLFGFSLKKPAEENYEEMQECVGRFLRAVVCGQGRSGVYSVVEAKHGGVETLSVGCHDCDEWQFAALCSAVGSASVTKHLRLYGVFGMSDSAEVRRWKWQWLAYALFRTSTGSSVGRALVTAAQLTREDVLAIAVTIHSNSPPAAVSAEVVREENLLHLGEWRRDTYGQFFEGMELTLLNPAQATERRSSPIRLEADSWLHIVNDDCGHFNVVLPGFGIARMDRLGATQVEQHRAPKDTSACGLKSLTVALALHADHDEGDVLADFLQLIGTPLESLALYAIGSYPISMASIGQACPQLTDLFLEGVELLNPSDFCLDVERCKCRLKCLGLVNVFRSNDQITRLAQALASPSSHIARHLSELGVSGSETSCCIDQANVLAFLSMLRANRKLAYLSLGMSPELQTLHDDSFRRHHGEPLPVVKDNLPILHKLAFLSAMRGQQQQQQQQTATGLLDDGVLTHILGFAATCATRAVTIHYDD